MNAPQERFGPLDQTGADIAAEEIKGVIDAYAKSIDGADTALASEIWSNSEDVSFIHPRGHERGWEQVKRNFHENTMGASFSDRKLRVYNTVVHTYKGHGMGETHPEVTRVRSGAAQRMEDRGEPP